MRKPQRIPTTDRNNKIVCYTLKKAKNTSGTTHYRVTGTLHKEHLDKKFKHRWEAERFIETLQKQEDAARSKQEHWTLPADRNPLLELQGRSSVASLWAGRGTKRISTKQSWGG